MNIWLERFVLVLLAAIAGATILTNPWRLDRLQQTTLIVAIAAIALFAGRTIERNRADQAAAFGQPSRSMAAAPPAVHTPAVERAPAPSDWVVDTPLNGARVWHASISSGKHLYVLGGFNRPAGPGSDARYRTTEWTTVARGGELEPWRPGPQMTRIRIGASAAIIGKFLYVAGGETGEVGQPCDRPESCFTASIERAAIRDDGSLGPWELIGNMRSERWGFAGVVVGATLYVIGGNDGKKPVSSVERLTFGENGDIVASQPLTGLNVPRWALAAARCGQFVYVFGGYDGEITLRTIERARILDAGALGPWELAGTMVDRRQGGAVFANEDRVYVIGGYSGAGPGETPNNVYLDTAESAMFENDRLAQFRRISPMRSRRGYFGLTAIAHRLYAIGGGTGDAFAPTVERLDLR